MGVYSYVEEQKVKVSQSRLFKALITEFHKVLPKVSPGIKSVEFVKGNTMAPGCVYIIKFVEGGPFTYIKTRMDSIDYQNHSCKFTNIEGELLGDKLEKIVHELKVEAAGDGESVVKLTTECHCKGCHEPSEMEIQNGKAHAVGANIYKTIENYMVAHPTICA